MTHDRLALAAAMLCALLVSATAAEAGSRGHMFDRMDRDQDGLITGQEFAMAREHMFERVDEDGDGYLTREEIAMRRGGHSDDRRSEHALRRFDRIDGDHDERISKQEFVAGAGRWLHRADADGDGAVSREEWLDAMAHKRAWKHEGEAQ